MKLPKSVKICHLEYEIIPWKPLEHEGEDLGVCLPHSLKIMVQDSVPLQVQKDTLLHEIMHAICYWYNVLDTDREEAVVSKISTGVLQVLTDNPKVAKFLTK